jgi:hypothetical protein
VIDPDQIYEVAVFSRPYSAMWDRESLAAFKLALDVVKAKGIRSKSRDGVDVLIHQAELVSIEWTVAKQDRPNGLNVWRHGDLKSFRVLDVIWRRHDAVDLGISGRRGTVVAARTAGLIKLGNPS